MKEIFDRFWNLLKNEDKPGAVRYAIQLLETNRIGVVELYEQVLAPLLNTMHCPENDETCIWREHVRTSIVRAIVEVSYPFVLKEKERPEFQPVGKTVLVVCPPEEYHEIGARMASDFFDLAGFDTKFVGANTPNRDILSAIRQLKPHFVAISVTNYYNLIKTKSLIEAIQALDPALRVLLGGTAFRDVRHVECLCEGSRINTYADILALAQEVR